MITDVAAVHDLLRELAAAYQERYGAAVFDVQAEPSTDGRWQIRGTVLLERQRTELIERLRALVPTLEDRLRVLSDPSVEPLAWARPRAPYADVRRQPGDSDATPPLMTAKDDKRELLNTQALPQDPPLRILARQEAWRLVQMWDRTLGWVHTDHLEEIRAQRWAEFRVAAAGGTLPLEVTPQQFAEAGHALVGLPYLLGGASREGGMDCSALVQRLYWETCGVLLPKHTGDQRRLGLRVSRADAQVGDLLFYKSRKENFSHVAIALDGGGQTLLHASRSRGRVCIEPFDQVAQTYAFLGARRIIRFAPVSRLASPSVSPSSSRIDAAIPASLRGRNVHVVGFAGAEGAAIVRWLVSHGVSSVTAHDFSTPDQVEKNFRLSHVGLKPRQRSDQFSALMQAPVQFCYRDRYLQGIDQAEVVYLPQGWFLYDSNAPLKAMRERGGVVYSQMTELYFRLAPCPIAAVTGSNGKSTTTRLLAELLGESGRPLLFAGNDRRNVQVLDELENFSPSGILVLEVSNRQLIDLQPNPHVAVVTNVTPDHIEEHGSFEAYADVKRKLVKWQKPGDYAVLNRDNEITWGFRQDTSAQVFPFGLQPSVERGAWLRDGHLVVGDETLCKATDMRMRGSHNVANALAASAAAMLCGSRVDGVRTVLKRFEGIALRLQPVADVNGVKFYNDVKATTPEATSAAVDAFSEKLVVILGGGSKGLDYSKLAPRLRDRARALVLLQSAGGEAIAQAARDAGVEESRLHTVHDLAAAVQTAYQLAQSGDVVLLSPACPGLFSMYMDEGKGFASLVRELGKR